MIRIGVLASGSGSNLQALLDATRDGRIDGKVAAVIVNVPGARALERAQAAGVPAELLPSKGIADREAYDRELVARLRRGRSTWSAWPAGCAWSRRPSSRPSARPPPRGDALGS